MCNVVTEVRVYETILPNGCKIIATATFGRKLFNPFKREAR
jgi:hypothetical protein